MWISLECLYVCASEKDIFSVYVGAKHRHFHFYKTVNKKELVDCMFDKLSFKKFVFIMLIQKIGVVLNLIYNDLVFD